MLEKIFGLIFAIAGTCGAIFFILCASMMVKMHNNIMTWCASGAIFALSALVIMIAFGPLCMELEKSKRLKKSQTRELGLFAVLPEGEFS
jgi:hypothetical protein